MKTGLRLALATACLGSVAPASTAPRAKIPSIPTAVSIRPAACALAGDRDRIIADCTADIASGKGSAPLDVAYFARGNAYAIKGSVDLALADYTAALALRPSAKIYNNRALMYEAKGDIGHAIADFDQALRLEPHDPAALLGRGRDFARQGQDEKALADFDRAIAVAPNFPFAYLGRSVVMLRRRDLARARNDITRYRQLMPSDPEGAKAEAAIRAATDSRQQ